LTLIALWVLALSLLRSNKMILISKDGKTKDITRKELNIIKDEICFCLHQGINQCKGSNAIIKALTNYVVEVEALNFISV
jgi:hypothetical protein